MENNDKIKNNKYTFSGAVFKFNVLHNRYWRAETIAPSKEKAISNLKYRYKKENGLEKSVPIKLEGTVTKG